MHYEELLNKAINAASGCSSGLWAHNAAFCLGEEEAGGPKAVAFLGSGHPGAGYWYGHVCPFRGRFASMIVQFKHFIQDRGIHRLFEYFAAWGTWKDEYIPCVVQRSDDAFAMSNSFHDAINSLVSMIYHFDVYKRCLHSENFPFEFNIIDLRPRWIFLYPDFDSEFPIF
jgi:hypothetical protein